MKTRLIEWYRRLKHFEPTRLRAAWAAIVLSAAQLGVTVPTDVDKRVVGILTVICLLLPILQGERTRSEVWSPASAAALAGDFDAVPVGGVVQMVGAQDGGPVVADAAEPGGPDDPDAYAGDPVEDDFGVVDQENGDGR